MFESCLPDHKSMTWRLGGLRPVYTFDFCRRDTPPQSYRDTRLIDVFRTNHRDLFGAPSEDVGDLLVGKPGRLAVCRTRAAEIVEVTLDLARQLRVVEPAAEPWGSPRLPPTSR